MPRIFEQVPIQTEDGYGFVCRGYIHRHDKDGKLKKVDDLEPEDCFQSTGWPTPEIAEARAEEHRTEHRTGECSMTPLHLFREKHGLTVEKGKAVPK